MQIHDPNTRGQLVQKHTLSRHEDEIDREAALGDRFRQVDGHTFRAPSDKRGQKEGDGSARRP